MGRAEMRTVPVDLDALRDEVIRELAPETEGRDIVWEKTPLPRALGDPGLLRQVFQNLLLNAVKYTRPRSPARIEIGCAGQTPEEIILFVRDNGVGFDMNTPRNCSAFSSASIAARNLKAPASAWPTSAALSPATAAAPGAEAKSMPAPPFTSRSLRPSLEPRAFI